MTRAIASFGYIGLLPLAPGTWASLAALPCAWLLHWLGGFPLLALATLLVVAVGWWAVQAQLAVVGDPDPRWIVIDEVAAQWVALFPLSAGLWFADAPPHVFPWPGWLGSFLAFRLFDIWKPGPIGWADRQHGAFGVMMDDLLAGIAAALAVAIAAAVAHGVLM